MRTVSERKQESIEEKFARLALPHRSYLFGLAGKLTGNRALAEDLLQDTYYKAYSAFATFDGSSRCRAWLKRIMINTYINSYNRNKKVVFCSQNDDEISQYPDKPKSRALINDDLDEESLLKNFVSDETRDSLLNLSSEYRLALIMYDMIGIPYKEMAEILEIPIGTVKSRLFRARIKFKANHEKNGPSGRISY